MRILIAEDHVDLGPLLANGLRNRGYAVDLATDGQQALDKAGLVDYDILVLDRDLPVVHGDDVCRALRGAAMLWPGLILMLTASGAIDDRVGGLRLGADDYLPKPFAFVELVARLEALERRTGRQRPLVLERAGLRLDPAARTVYCGKQLLTLTPREFGVLKVLLAGEGDVISSEALLHAVWDEHADPFSNVVRVTVMRLRKKLGQPERIETVTGVGYRIQ